MTTTTLVRNGNTFSDAIDNVNQTLIYKSREH